MTYFLFFLPDILSCLLFVYVLKSYKSFKHHFRRFERLSLSFGLVISNAMQNNRKSHLIAFLFNCN